MTNDHRMQKKDQYKGPSSTPFVHTGYGRKNIGSPLNSLSKTQAFAHAKDREKARAQATAALMAAVNDQGGEDDSPMSRTLVGGGGGSGGAAVATVLGHGPQTPMRQARLSSYNQRKHSWYFSPLRARKTSQFVVFIFVTQE